MKRCLFLLIFLMGNCGCREFVVIKNSKRGKKFFLKWTEVQVGDQDGKFKYSLNPTQYFLVTKE